MGTRLGLSWVTHQETALLPGLCLLLLKTLTVTTLWVAVKMGSLHL